MSSADVGDAVELTFEITTGATVTATWYDPVGTVVLTAVPVPETPAGSGKYPYTFVATSPGVWTATFTASGAAVAVERYFVRAYPVTGPPPLATISDVEELNGPLDTSQSGLVAALIRHASRMIRARYPDLDARIVAGDLDLADAALAVTQMILRVLRNPHGIRSESVGPFTRTFDTTSAAGLLSITDAETALLAGLADEPVPVVRTIWARPGLAPPPSGTLDYSRVPGW